MNYLYVALGFLLSFYPTAAVSSQSLLDLSLCVMVLVLVLLRVKKAPGLAFRWIGIEWAFAGYLLVVLVGFYVNEVPSEFWPACLMRFSWLLNIYILILALGRIRFESTAMIKVLSALTLVPTLYSLASYSVGFDLLTGRDNSRLTGFVNSATYHAHGNALIFVFLLAGLLFSFRRLSLFWKYFSTISTVLMGASILFTFTRGVWLSILLSSLATLLFVDRKKCFQFLLGSLVVFGVFSQVSPKFTERTRTQELGEANEERISLFKLNVQIWEENPWLGLGYGENIRRNREFWDRPEWNKPAGYITSHAHNQYLNVLATTGVFGLVFFAAFALFFLIKNAKLLLRTSRELQPERFLILLACLWAQIEFLLACLTDVGFEYAKIRALIIFVWALVVVLERKPEVVDDV